MFKSLQKSAKRLLSKPSIVTGKTLDLEVAAKRRSEERQQQIEAFFKRAVGLYRDDILRLYFAGMAMAASVVMGFLAFSIRLDMTIFWQSQLFLIAQSWAFAKLIQEHDRSKPDYLLGLIFFVLAVSNAVFSIFRDPGHWQAGHHRNVYAFIMLWSTVTAFALSKAVQDRSEAKVWSQQGGDSPSIKDIKDILKGCQEKSEHRHLKMLAPVVQMVLMLNWTWRKETDMSTPARCLVTVSSVFCLASSYHAARLVNDVTHSELSRMVDDHRCFQCFVGLSCMLSVGLPLVLFIVPQVPVELKEIHTLPVAVGLLVLVCLTFFAVTSVKQDHEVTKLTQEVRKLKQSGQSSSAVPLLPKPDPKHYSSFYRTLALFNQAIALLGMNEYYFIAVKASLMISFVLGFVGLIVMAAHPLFLQTISFPISQIVLMLRACQKSRCRLENFAGLATALGCVYYNVYFENLAPFNFSRFPDLDDSLYCLMLVMWFGLGAQCFIKAQQDKKNYQEILDRKEGAEKKFYSTAARSSTADAAAADATTAIRTYARQCLQCCRGNLLHRLWVYSSSPIALGLVLLWTWDTRSHGMDVSLKSLVTVSSIFSVASCFHLARLYRDLSDPKLEAVLEDKGSYQVLVHLSFLVSAGFDYWVVFEELSGVPKLVLGTGVLFMMCSAFFVAKHARDAREIAKLQVDLGVTPGRLSRVFSLSFVK